jgi:ketosteroid isomerase-like protein
MVDRSRVEEFVDAVLNGNHADAIRNFYHGGASMQENLAEPRRGLEQLIVHEEASLERIQAIRTHPPRTLLVEQDTVVIEWIFDITDRSGAVRRLQEVAVQRWEADRIMEERFFYDSATAWQPVQTD